MKCNGFQNLLPLELEGQLRGELKVAFHKHIAECPVCSANWNNLKETEKVLQQHTFTPPPLATDFTEKVIKQITAKQEVYLSRYLAIGFAGASFALFTFSFIIQATNASFALFSYYDWLALYGYLRGMVEFVPRSMMTAGAAIISVFASITIAYFVLVNPRTTIAFSSHMGKAKGEI